MRFEIRYCTARDDGNGSLVTGPVRTLERRWSTLYPLSKLMTEWSGYFTGEKQIPGHKILNGALIDVDAGGHSKQVQSFDNQTIPPVTHSDGKGYVAVLEKLARESRREAERRDSLSRNGDSAPVKSLSLSAGSPVY